MNSLPVFNNPGLTTPRETPAAVLSCGIKNAGGGMILGSTERFWLGLATGADKKTPRKPHPAFAPFNGDRDAKGSTKPQAFMRCVLVHDDINQARKIDRSAYRGPTNDRRVRNPAHQGPWCSGDGTRAARWDGETYQDIACPNLDCPYSQGREPACKVRLTVLFYPRWDGTPFEEQRMPQLLTKYVSKGRRMHESFEGLIQHARQQANSFGIEIKSWHGFPYAMTLAMRTAPGRRYTDVSFTPDGDLLTWLVRQKDQAALLGAATPYGLLEAPLNTEEQAGIDEDLVSPDPVGPATKPARVAVAGKTMKASVSAAFAKELRRWDALEEFCDAHGLPPAWPASLADACRAAIEAAKKEAK